LNETIEMSIVGVQGMSYASEMLSIASRARPELHEGAGEVAHFVRSRQLQDGQFRGRGEEGDIYYTVFGIDCLLALDEEIDRAALGRYLTSFGCGENLDLMHLGCLARCWSRLDREGLTSGNAAAILKRVESYRSEDGGYHIERGAKCGSIYGCFLAYAAYQDLAAELPEVERVADSIEALHIDGGLYASEQGFDKPTTNAAVGALLMLSSLGRSAGNRAGEWLLEQHHAKGGFVAAPEVPIPDLVSTATALFALRKTGMDVSGVKEGCINFLGSVWNDDGGFSGNWMDETSDCEYTFYALLSLGCLAAEEKPET